ncbi:alpha-E domain-containing protein [Adhaeribacter aquaticus]|uniref:alpha-E domain-containing protein n=1 Tax=Adhaeribacter aquaticus TaxID=299567 RepID=UPI00047CA7C2|nr:alpha-E domain-containing protein [Adhaeribacter aquaticus]
MLSRIGNSLFWLGRYLERAEHVARYTKVQYVSSLDAPLVQSKEFVLESILNMTGMYSNYFNKFDALSDDDVLYFVTLSKSNPSSIAACIAYIRENARGARDSISSELWEAINRFYHSVNSFTETKFHNEGIFNFSQMIENNSSVIKGYIDNTLIRNEVWNLIGLGVHIERAAQVNTIILTKLNDIEKHVIKKYESSLENYQYNTMLKSAEAFDMFKRLYNTNTNRKQSLEFLIFNPKFPKSIAYNLILFQKNIQELGFPENGNIQSLNFWAGKLACNYQYKTIEEVEGDIKEFLKQSLSNIFELATKLENKYLKF